MESDSNYFNRKRLCTDCMHFLFVALHNGGPPEQNERHFHAAKCLLFNMLLILLEIYTPVEHHTLALHSTFLAFSLNHPLFSLLRFISQTLSPYYMCACVVSRWPAAWRALVSRTTCSAVKTSCCYWGSSGLLRLGWLCLRYIYNKNVCLVSCMDFECWLFWMAVSQVRSIARLLS